METEEQREIMLQRMRITHSERMAVETEEQREVRLQRMRIAHSERMAVETEEQREARLQRMHANQSDRLAAETEEQREARLQSYWLFLHSGLMSTGETLSFQCKSYVLHLQLQTVSIHSI